MTALPTTVPELAELVRKKLVACARACEAIAQTKTPGDRIMLGVRAAVAGRSLIRAKKALARADAVAAAALAKAKRKPLTASQKAVLRKFASTKNMPRVVHNKVAGALVRRELVEAVSHGAAPTWPAWTVYRATTAGLKAAGRIA